HFYHNDHLFTPQRLTDNTGTLSWSADYSAFGETTITKETIINNLRFPGQYYDADIKLAQNYYRDYSAELGRYIETDLISLNGGINLYAYSLNSPLIMIDPEGMKSFFSCLKDCTIKQYDILVPVITYICGAPTIKKRFVTQGSSPRTSLCSKYLGDNLGNMKKKRRAPTWRNPGATTLKRGRFIARWIPIISTVWFAIDTIQIGICTKRCMDDC
ncbi:MAG: hypothetical protein CSA42_07820, partial [Gammaproteobacteria bacterium]